MILAAALDAAFAEAVDTGVSPGIVALVTTDREVVYEGAFGRRNLESGDAMTLDTVFWIASMTKAVTSIAAMRLVEQGRLDLDAPVGRLVPALHRPNILLGFDAQGAPRLRPATTAVTLRHLLTHTSGFAYPQWNADALRYRQWADFPPTGSGKLAALDYPLAADPGTQWEYGIGTDWLGRVVEATSGETLDAYAERHIFAPVGMTDTSFFPSPSQQARHSAMHLRQADGTLAVMAFGGERPENAFGGGGLHGTAGDYGGLVRTLLAGGAANGARLLRAETIALMAQDHLGATPLRVLPAILPGLTNVMDLGTDRTWGLGFLINKATTPEGRSAGSLAWAGLPNCYYWIDRTRRIGGVMLQQFLPFADVRALQLFAAFEKAVYDDLDAGGGA